MATNEVELAVAALDQGNLSHPFRPKGIWVGLELAKALKEKDRIHKVPVIHALGVYFGEKAPALDGDIWVFGDPFLGDFEFRLPTIETD